MSHQSEEPPQRGDWAKWFGGCFVGCLLGAVGGPFAFLLLTLILAWLTSDSNDAGSPLWIVLAIPVGAIIGAIAFPLGRELWEMIAEEIKDRRQRD